MPTPEEIERRSEIMKFVAYPYPVNEGNLEDEIDHAKRQIYKMGVIAGAIWASAESEKDAIAFAEYCNIQGYKISSMDDTTRMNIFKQYRLSKLYKKILKDNMDYLTAEEKLDEYILKKMIDWQEDYDYVSWQEFKDEYSYCDRCKSWYPGRCICYAR